jgi:hypothetical protein
MQFTCKTPTIKLSTYDLTVLWAQRSSSTDPAKNFVYLTLTVPNVPEADLKLDITPTKLTLTGKSKVKKTTYHVELEFFAEVETRNQVILRCR